MGYTCHICNSDKRLQIDRMLCQGKGYQKIANETGESAQAIRRHYQNGHVNYQLETAQRERDILEGLNLQAEIDNLIHRTKDILYKAEQGEKLSTALKGIDSLRNTYQLMTDVAFRLHDARVKELELEREKTGQREQEDENQFWQDVHNNLNDAELDLFQKLIEKIEGEADVDVVAEYRADPEIEYLQGLEKLDWSAPKAGPENQNDFEFDDDDLDEDEPAPEQPEPKQPEPDPDEHLKPECEKKIRRTRPPKPGDGISRAIREFD